ncbi:RNA methyltransferase [Ampullimonas aquatilis]|uniref:RNA methyltransferase n=1 Tax=Ampullimonas aquatilis TaxID=1341549 RepID=UPI003C72D516
MTDQNIPDSSSSATTGQAAQRLPAIRFILLETSHPGNIGSACRAIKTMGLHELWLVNPKILNPAANAEAISLSSGALDVLNGARVVPSLSTALEGVQLAIALSARPRQFGPPIQTIRHTIEQLRQHYVVDGVPANADGVDTAAPSASTAQLAFVFGNERFGLPNEAIERCQIAAQIPAHPGYSSLNLAQAVQLVAYECRMAGLVPGVSAADAAVISTDVGFSGDAATIDQIDGMYAHLERMLVEIGFLDTTAPKKLMPRLRRLFSRTGLEVEEVNILRGICNAVMAKLP